MRTPPEQRIVMIPGPDGAGKTTFARRYLPNEAGGPAFLNPDEIAVKLCPEAPERVAIRAARVMLDQSPANQSHIDSPRCPWPFNLANPPKKYLMPRLSVTGRSVPHGREPCKAQHTRRKNAFPPALCHATLAPWIAMQTSSVSKTSLKTGM